MKRIRIPVTRAYCPASKNEPDRLLYWIPPEELEHMVRARRLAPDLLEDFPDGLEVQVSAAAFDEFGIDVGVRPEDIVARYDALRRSEEIPEHGQVDADWLEEQVRAPRQRPEGAVAKGKSAKVASRKLAEPQMTEGENLMSALLSHE